MKNCRYCYTNIHDRATICLECHRSQTFSGWIKSFLITGFPILAAFISIGFAVYEKVQANIAQHALAVTENKLDVEESRVEVAEDAVVNLTEVLVQNSGTVSPIVTSSGPDSESQLSDQDKLAAIQASLDEHAKNPVLTKEQIKQKHIDALNLRTEIRLREPSGLRPNR